jgi:hypothetical protein
MAEKSLLEQMLERLVNDDQAKAEELFHEYVVAKSREIYENLIEAEMDEEDAEDEEVKEVADDEEAEEDKVDENFEDIAVEADDEFGGPAGDMGDDLEGEMGPEEGEEDLSADSEEELFQDLDAIVDELQARFDSLGGDHAEPDADNAGGPSDMDADNENFDLATVREYVEKVGNGHGAEKKGQGEGQFSGTGKLSDKPNVNAKSIVAGKNDMGGTSANILSSKEEAPKYAGAGGGQLGGSSLFKGTPKEDNAGNINVPGGKAGGAFSKKEPGHGAEKKGEAEGKFSGAGGSSGSVDKASLFRGRR